MYTFTDTYAEERNGQPKLGLEQLKAGTSYRLSTDGEQP